MARLSRGVVLMSWRIPAMACLVEWRLDPGSSFVDQAMKWFPKRNLEYWDPARLRRFAIRFQSETGISVL